jgi:hypothetical protein
MATAAVLQMHHREEFERNVTRALVAGAGAGLLAFLTNRLHLPVPLSFLALSATALACVRGDRLDRWLLAGLSVVLPAVPWLLGLTTGWTIAFAGAATGLLMVKSRLAEKGEEGSLAADRPGAVHYVVGAAATAGLALAGTEVAQVLAVRLGQLQAPPLVAHVVAGSVVALFAGLGGLAAHLALKADPVEARCEEVIPTLSAELQVQGNKALSLYRQCGQTLAALPREPAREELARTIQKLTRDAIELAAEWAGVEAHVQEDAHAALAKEIADLQQSARSAKDVVAKKQLELAATSLGDELERMEELKLKRERVVAKLRAQVALLERARVSLIGMRSSQASVRAAELSAVSRKLNALALAQADEARLAHEVATSAELAAHELAAHDHKTRAQVAAGGPQSGLLGTTDPAPVVEVSPRAAPRGEGAPEDAKALATAEGRIADRE